MKCEKHKKIKILIRGFRAEIENSFLVRGCQF